MSLHPETREKIASNAYWDDYRERRERKRAMECDTDAMFQILRDIESKSIELTDGSDFDDLPSFDDFLDKYRDRVREIEKRRTT